ncbi:MAG: DNA-directed RNA polymerase subunit K [Thermoproteota archaeon]
MVDEKELELVALRNSIEERVELLKKKLTKFEKARIIGLRALELSLGAPPLIPIDQEGGRMSTIEIAKREVEMKVLPLIIGRRMPDNTYAYVPLSELEIED